MEAKGSRQSAQQRYAVITGANKGIGFETSKQLASKGVMVVLTARDEKRGLEATSKLHDMGFPNVVFHQLDVLDPTSAKSLALFLKEKFGRLDILVNNAGASGVIVDEDGLRAMNIDPAEWLAGKVANLVQGVIKHTYQSAELCLNTNYYGVKRVTEALLPLLQLSPSGARSIPNEKTRKVLGDLDTLTEEKIDAILQKFLNDLETDALEKNGWSTMLPAYSISKATLNAYTRVLAKKYPSMCINCVHPGYVNTDINWHTGVMTLEEGASGPVMLALLPEGSPTGCYFDQTQLAEF
ncbi:hypothetical protein SAY87_016229 [Trapa incisa]|uniref:Uncharacterized protein n=1 Tax=Trapa incisa TaxID=236973 RepID=A0AAN7QYU5_9MYRT|nr:hypothetical protein SAY87_016229 [Trapa incisa]